MNPACIQVNTSFMFQEALHDLCHEIMDEYIHTVVGMVAYDDDIALHLDQ